MSFVRAISFFLLYDFLSLRLLLCPASWGTSKHKKSYKRKKDMIFIKLTFIFMQKGKLLSKHVVLVLTLNWFYLVATYMCTAVATGNHIQRKLSEMRQENDCKWAVRICSVLKKLLNGTLQMWLHWVLVWYTSTSFLVPPNYRV